jgi:hypothetical protein
LPKLSRTCTPTQAYRPARLRSRSTASGARYAMSALNCGLLEFVADDDELDMI